MPITVPDGLPAIKTLEKENIFIMNENRAVSQDIRPLRILMLNLMPTKIETETQILRLLGNTPLQVDAELLQTATHVARHVSPKHMFKFYRHFDDVKDERYDGMVITGAPVEKLDFDKVDYWPELCAIMEWSKTHVYSTLHICWGAQAGLYYHFGVDKHLLPEKLSGIYGHRNLMPQHPLVRGFDDCFYAPHSRYTGVDREKIEGTAALDVLSDSPLAGVYLVANKSGRQFFVTGHAEYDRTTLAREYSRDVKAGLGPRVPENYFPADDPTKTPIMTWRGHAHMLFANWLNYFVYQSTPYDLSKLGE